MGQMTVLFLRMFQYVRELERRAFHDELTGLLRRGRFFEVLAMELRNARAGGEHVAFFYLDLNGFKIVNDSHGHAVGDRFLTWVAGRIVRYGPHPKVICRMGGDEFAVFTRLKEEVFESRVALLMKEDLETQTFCDSRTGIEIPLSISVGYASTRTTGYTNALHELPVQADKNMYGEKAHLRVREKMR